MIKNRLYTLQMITKQRGIFLDPILQCLSKCSDMFNEVKMTWYNKVRYELAPSIFLVFFTSSSFLLPCFGREDNFTLLGLISSILGNVVSWTFVAAIFSWAWIWLIIPRKTYYGPITIDGTTPIYKGRGLIYYCVTVITYTLCEAFWPGMSLLIYSSMPQILGNLNIVAFSLCVYFYFTPSQIPQNSKFPKLYLFYRGREIHLRMLGVDTKQFIISRIGLMLWQLLVLAYFYASVDTHGFNFPTFVSFLLQSIYLCKFYLWEKGYYYTLDIILDRIGYYLIWGCLVWVPGFYTFTSYYLVSHIPVISNGLAFFFALLGIISILMNYWVDAQKLHFRSSPDGKCVIWGNPAKFIRAKYKDRTGKERNSLLLTSGLWGVARHLNYTFEIASSIFWCLPSLWLGVQPFLYVPFIIILLLHRVFRDEEKCKEKYGQFWNKYCEKVPYRLIPKIF